MSYEYKKYEWNLTDKEQDEINVFIQNACTEMNAECVSTESAEFSKEEALWMFKDQFYRAMKSRLGKYKQPLCSISKNGGKLIAYRIKKAE